jgi:hypothetical protein
MPWARPLEKGKRYLILMKSDNKGHALVGETNAWEITESQMLRSVYTAVPGWGFDGLPLIETIERLREKVIPGG